MRRKLLIGNKSAGGDVMVVAIDTSKGDGLPNFTFRNLNTADISQIDWGDGVINSGTNTHTYAIGGHYTIFIKAKSYKTIRFVFTALGEKDKLVEIKHWGDFELTTTGSFRGCSNLSTITTTYFPKISTADLSNTFLGCNLSDSDFLDDWDFSNVVNASNMFNDNFFTKLVGLNFTGIEVGSDMFRNNLINYIDNVIFNSLKNGSNLFRNNPLMVLPDEWLLPALEDASTMFYNTPIEYIFLNIPNCVTVNKLNYGNNSVLKQLKLITSSALTDVRDLVLNKSNLVDLFISDCSGVLSGYETIGAANCPNLLSIVLYGWAHNLDIRNSVLMTEANYLALIDSLADLTSLPSKTLTVKNHAAFTSACDSAAAAKNWNVTKI
jgi:hypothetical protein